MEQDELMEVIVQLNEWYDNKIKQLEIISNLSDDTTVKFENSNGETVDLPTEARPAFIAGVKVALEVFGKFPVTFEEQ
jgi:hypothetical protein